MATIKHIFHIVFKLRFTHENVREKLNYIYIYEIYIDMLNLNLKNKQYYLFINVYF